MSPSEITIIPYIGFLCFLVGYIIIRLIINTDPNEMSSETYWKMVSFKKDFVNLVTLVPEVSGILNQLILNLKTLIYIQRCNNDIYKLLGKINGDLHFITTRRNEKLLVQVKSNINLCIKLTDDLINGRLNEILEPVEKSIDFTYELNILYRRLEQKLPVSYQDTLKQLIENIGYINKLKINTNNSRLITKVYTDDLINSLELFDKYNDVEYLKLLNTFKLLSDNVVNETDKLSICDKDRLNIINDSLLQ